jgi:hypothetical protein
MYKNSGSVLQMMNTVFATKSGWSISFRELFFTETNTDHIQGHAVKRRDCTCYSRRYTCCGYRLGFER